MSERKRADKESQAKTETELKETDRKEKILVAIKDLADQKIGGPEFFDILKENAPKDKINESLKVAIEDAFSDKAKPPRYPVLTPAERNDYRRLVLKAKQKSLEVQRLNLQMQSFLWNCAQEAGYADFPEPALTVGGHIVPSNLLTSMKPDELKAVEGTYPKVPDARKEEYCKIRDRQRKATEELSYKNLEVDDWITVKMIELDYLGNHPVKVEEDGTLRPDTTPRR